MYKKRLWQMRARIFAWAQIMTAYCQDKPVRKVMIGLTLREIEDYKPGMMNDYLKKLKQSLGEGLIAFAWVCELQMRKAVHYHLLLVVKKGTNIPMPDASGMWTHGSSNICTAKTFFYICKYVGKEYQKDFDKFPKSARLYAASIRGDKISLEAFRALSGLNMGKSDGSSDFVCVGSSVTRDYADMLLDTRNAIMG